MLVLRDTRAPALSSCSDCVCQLDFCLGDLCLQVGYVNGAPFVLPAARALISQRRAVRRSRAASTSALRGLVTQDRRQSGTIVTLDFHQRVPQPVTPEHLFYPRPPAHASGGRHPYS
jgi:hypothetical protein